MTFEEKIESILGQQNLDGRKPTKQILSAVRQLIVEELDDVVAHGHGGGNWRRIIEMKRSSLLQALGEKIEMQPDPYDRGGMS